MDDVAEESVPQAMNEINNNVIDDIFIKLIIGNYKRIFVKPELSPRILKEIIITKTWGYNQHSLKQTVSAKQ